MSDIEYGITIPWCFVYFLMWIATIVLIAGVVHCNGKGAKSQLESELLEEKEKVKTSLAEKEKEFDSRCLREKDEKIGLLEKNIDVLRNEITKLYQEKRDLVEQSNLLSFRLKTAETQVKSSNIEMKKKDEELNDRLQEIAHLKSFYHSTVPGIKNKATGKLPKKAYRPRGP